MPGVLISKLFNLWCGRTTSFRLTVFAGSANLRHALNVDVFYLGGLSRDLPSSRLWISQFAGMA